MESPFFILNNQGCHDQRKTKKFLKFREIFDAIKVSEKSKNSVFRFIVHKFSSRF